MAEFKPGDWVRAERWGEGEYYEVHSVRGNRVELLFRGEVHVYYYPLKEWRIKGDEPHTDADLAMALQLADLLCRGDLWADDPVGQWLRSRVQRELLSRGAK